jgi:IclR family acetate operon transcriptional repressor
METRTGMETEELAGNGQIKSVEKAIKLLGIFDANHKHLTYSEICLLSKMPVGSVYRFLLTLNKCGFLDYDTSTKKYSLGPKIIYLGNLATESIDLVKIAHPFMEEIRRITNETVSLFIRRDFKKICICKVESEHSIRYSSRVGKMVYLHGGASGKVLMSTFSKNELDRYEKEEGFKSLTSTTLTKRSQVEEALRKTREDGYAISSAERSENSAGIGVPIFDCNKKAVACLNITLPSDRYDQTKIPEWIDLLKKAGLEISRRNGY